MKLFGGKIRKQILKIAEGITAVIEILGLFDFLIADRILYKNIAPPISAVFIGVIILSVNSRNKV